MSISIDVGTAHSGTTRLGIREIVRQLNSGLGATLVAALAGGKDSKISYRWARMDGPEPRPEAQARLQLAHRAWTAVSSVEGEHVTRLWFVGANPWLDEVSPIEAIKDMRAKEVMAATTAMTEDRFPG
ncbi:MULTISPECIES: hypothetical protein [unclassified Arthrobacter]|uniref:hypothetical protein n=1 Tax=Micrococcaceae TaxID=1268 RepID=UPI001CC7AF01|nr:MULTISPECIES: hypothetical protein [unclassified Arthrobacter]BCW77894.1 hypothetical protein NicSoilB11_42190 [Arthrobacter sp. NicSoilB11]GIU58018.1 hypothetical protein NicSoilC12_37670 [Arthrobacter sp. NicSoilC12]